MKLQKTAKKIGCCATVDGSGWVLYGRRPDDGKWLERWFPTREAAEKFAGKRSWVVEVIEQVA